MIRALTLRQPWAQLVALGQKRVETRSWTTTYRGWLGIHAALAFPGSARELARREPFRRALDEPDFDAPEGGALPRGAIIAVATLEGVGQIGRRSDGAIVVHGMGHPIDGDERAFGDFTPGRYGWTLSGVYRLRRPIPCRGKLGLWKLPPDVELEVRDQLGNTLTGS